MALEQPIFNSPLLSGRPKLRRTRISAATISSPLKINKNNFMMRPPQAGPRLTSRTLQSVFADQEFLKAPDIPGKGEGTKQTNFILRELIETNRILKEVQNQLAIDFANRIVEKKENLRLQQSLLSKQRAKDKEDSIEGKIGKDTSFLSKAFDKVTKPVKGIFDRIKDFLTALALAITASAAFEWLKDENNRQKLAAFFNFIGEHWKWIVGIIAGGLILGGILKLIGLARRLKRLWDFFRRTPRPPTSGGRGLGGDPCTPLLNCAPQLAASRVLVSVLSSAAIADAIKNWPFLEGLVGKKLQDIPGLNPQPERERIREPVIPDITVPAFGSAFETALENLGSYWKSLEALALAEVKKVNTGTREAWESLKTATMGALDDMKAMFEKLSTDTQNSVQSTDWNKVGNDLGLLVDVLSVIAVLFPEPGTSAVGAAALISKYKWIRRLLQLSRAANSFAPAGGGADGGLITGGSYATGGLVRPKKKKCCDKCALGFSAGGSIYGPGTGTSDDIPIWASDGEYIINAKDAQTWRSTLVDFNTNGGEMWETFADSVKLFGKNNELLSAQYSTLNNTLSAFSVALNSTQNDKDNSSSSSVSRIEIKPFNSKVSDSNRSVFTSLTSGQRDRILNAEVGQNVEGVNVTDQIKFQLRNFMMELRTQSNNTLRRNSSTGGNNITSVDLGTNVSNGVSVDNSTSAGTTAGGNRGSRGEDITIQTFDSENRWILKALDLYEVEPSLWLGGAV